MIGERKDECGGSVYLSLIDKKSKNLPKPDFQEVENQIFAVIDIIENEFALSVHDISDGGIAVALAEMTFKNMIGFKVNIDSNIRTDKILFSQTGGFILEASKNNLKGIERILKSYKCEYSIIGNTDTNNKININNSININISDAKEAWSNGLRDKLL